MFNSSWGSYKHDIGRQDGKHRALKQARYSLDFKLSYSKSYINSPNETRPKNKLYNLLIYAGYPVKK